MRAVPASTVTSPPHIAASSSCTPSGRVQCQLRKVTGASDRFWVMKINNTIRIRKPAINDDHTLAVRVNLTAVSGGGAASGTGADASGGCSGDTDGSLLMVSFLPLAGVKGTERPGNVGGCRAGGS